MRFRNQIGDLISYLDFLTHKKVVKNSTLIAKSKVQTKTSDQSCATCFEYNMSVVFIRVIKTSHNGAQLETKPKL